MRHYRLVLGLLSFPTVMAGTYLCIEGGTPLLGVPVIIIGLLFVGALGGPRIVE